jgi:hypothetical protein
VFSRPRPFTDLFQGFDRVAVVRALFGDDTARVLRELQVEFSWLGGYMWVNGWNGHLMVNPRYLHWGTRLDVYLDVVHELVHIQQLRQGRDLFDGHYAYVERPTEIEAYRTAVDEARRLGVSDDRICQYLKTEWMSEDDLRRLAATLKVRC